MKSKRKKIAFRSSAIFLLFICFFLFLTFRSGFVQTAITQQIGNSFAEKTNTKVSIGGVEFRWLKTFVLRDFLVLDHHQDTLLFAEKLDLKVNEYNLESRAILLDKLSLESALVNLKKYAGEEDYNFKQLLDSLKLKPKKKKNAAHFILATNELELKGIKFKLWDENLPVKSFGVDYRHLTCDSLHGVINDFELITDSINAQIETLSFVERSGFRLKQLSANAVVSNSEMTLDEMVLKSSATALNGKLSFKYKRYSDWKKFVSKMKIQSNFDSSVLSGHDLSFFVPALEGIKDSVVFQGKVLGKIPRLKLRQFLFRFGEKTRFKGKLDVDGLPDVKNAFVYLDAKELVTIDNDLQKIPLPPFKEQHTLKTPKWLKNLKIIRFKGKYTGFSSDFVAYGTFNTACGKVKSDVKFTGDRNEGLQITGGINTSRFDLKKLLDQKELGLMAFNGAVSAKTKGNRFRFDVKGKLPFIDAHGYRYSGVQVDGDLTNTKFSGDVQVNDTNLTMNFSGGVDFSKQQQEYKFKAKVEKANIHNLGFVKRDTSTRVSFDMNIDVAGNNLKDIYGEVTVNDFDWHEQGHDYHFNTTNVKSMKKGNKELVTLKSDWFSGKIEGKYDLKELPSSLVNIVSRDLPSLVDWKYSKVKSKGKNDFRLMFKIYDYQLLHDLFTPDLLLSNAKFSGGFNDQSQVFHMNFSADTLSYKGKKANAVKLYAHNKKEQVNVVVKSNFVELKDSIGLNKFNLTMNSADNLTNYKVSWNNDKRVKNNASIAGTFGVEKLDSIWTKIDRFDFIVENNLWKIDTLNKVVFRPQRVVFDHFKVYLNSEYVDVKGWVSGKEKNNLTVKTENFNLGNLGRLFERYKVGVNGFVTGDFKLEGDVHAPIVKSDMEVNGLVINEQSFGKVCINSNYFSDQGRVGLNAYIENQSKYFHGNTFELSGDYYPKRNGELDLTANLSNVQLRFLERYFTGVFSDFKRGKTSGDLTVKGTLKTPEVYGHLRLDQMNLMVDYLNVKYAINGQHLYFNNDKIIFKDFTLKHHKYTKSAVVVHGNVFHTGFKNFSYKMDSIRMKDLFCLNTTINENASYYGTAFVDGLLVVEGNGKTNSISGAMSTVPYQDKLNKGATSLNLPLSEVGELEVSDFIHFVNLKEQAVKSNVKEEKLDLSGLSLDFNFLINEEATANIIFDPKVGDEIDVNGQGNINMKINSEGAFLMSGKYKIDRGKYFFTLKNFIGKKFLVEKGGTIVWDGDPLNANIDIKTHYQARAKLIDLANPTVPNYEILQEKYSNRTPVYASLNLNGELLQPEILMEVSLPNGTPDEKDFLSSHLIGEDEINRQVFALLLTNQFLPSSTTGITDAVNVGTGIDNGIQFLEGQLNNALGGVFNNLDLGVDYNSGAATDSLNNDELRLLLGFQYKKFSIKTDYSLNNAAGEIQVEYKLTDQLKAKAYRRTTETAIVQNGSNLTQGAGVVFQRTFDKVTELFRRKKKIKNEE